MYMYKCLATYMYNLYVLLTLVPGETKHLCFYTPITDLSQQTPIFSCDICWTAR